MGHGTGSPTHGPRSAAGKTGDAAGRGKLLVITSGGGTAALALPFDVATLIEIPDRITDAPRGGPFDTIVVDRRPFSLDWLEATTGHLLAALHSHGRLLLALGPDGDRPARPRSRTTTLDRLHWEEVTVLGGRPFGVLRLVPGTVPAAGVTTAVLIAANNALAATSTRGRDSAGAARSEQLTLLLRREREARRRSEHALIAHLAALAEELRQERARSRPRRIIRAVLQGSVAGRALLDLVRRVRELARPSAPRLCSAPDGDGAAAPYR